MSRKHWTRRKQRKQRNQRKNRQRKTAARPVRSAQMSYPPYADFKPKPKRASEFVRSTPGPLPKEPKNEPGDFMDWDYT